MYKKYGKRIFDIIASFFGLLILLPVMIVIALIIKLSSKGPVLFVQKRVGKNFQEFNLYKFRSMIVNADKLGPSVTKGNDKRITSIGRFLRKTKLDELPQLWNVLKGDMSLVGPRPEVMKYVKEKKKEYEKVLRVRPGITDYAAIEFRDEEEFLNRFQNPEKAYIEEVLPKKIELYYKYIDNISFLNDVKIILKTLKVL